MNPKIQSAIWLITTIFSLSILLALVLFNLWLIYPIAQGADKTQLQNSIAVIFNMQLRQLAVLIGGALCISGLMLSFWTHKTSTSLELDSDATNISLATYSPGIVAIITGAIIVISSVYAQTNISSTKKQDKEESSIDSISDAPRDERKINAEKSCEKKHPNDINKQKICTIDIMSQ